MSHTEQKHGNHGPGVDQEINTRGVVWTITGVALTTAVSMVLMLWLMNSLVDGRLAENPPPSPLAEANKPWDPPGPALQNYPPTTDIEVFRAHEEALATTFGWVDEEAQVVRIPVADALQILRDRGFPEGENVEALSAEIFGDAAPSADDGGGV